MNWGGICNWWLGFKRRHRRLWGVCAFPLLLLVTFVVMPISFLFDVLHDIPRMLRNLWNDLYHTTRGHVFWYRRLMSAVYADTWSAIRGRPADVLNEGEME